MDAIVKNYMELNSNSQNRNIKAFEPNPNIQDYNNQYIFRYFIRKRNEPNGIIYEVSKDTFDNYKNDSLYFGVKIKWKIWGDKKETEELNIKSVAFGKKTLSNLDSYIQNYVKYWKG